LRENFCNFLEFSPAIKAPEKHSRRQAQSNRECLHYAPVFASKYWCFTGEFCSKLAVFAANTGIPPRPNPPVYARTRKENTADYTHTRKRNISVFFSFSEPIEALYCFKYVSKC